ncbi:MAG: peptide ABC transporter substrate-binding protein [Chloroflexia bacterium]|nr:peptide ABC transporter substrate-binding protein [Chloroflexia bacterium]
MKTSKHMETVTAGSEANRIDRRELVKVMTALGLAVPAFGAGLAGSGRAALAQDTARGEPGGAVVVGVYQEPNSLNFLLTGGPISFASMQLTPLFEPMIRYNADGVMEPRLLTEIPTVDNGGVSEDGLTYTLTFVPDVTWHDGTPFTANDFRFTWEWIMDPANQAQATAGWAEIESVEVPDDLTAVVTLKGLYLPFVSEALGWNPLLPEHVQSTMSTEEFGRQPVGNGPFRFVEWIPGDHLTFARYEEYFRPEKALLDRLIFKVVPDRNTVIAQAKTGDIQLGIDYTEAQIPEMENVPGVTLIISPSQIYERYHFTMVTREDASVPHPIFGDITVRKALTHAIDRQTIIDQILFGRTEIARNELDNTPYENAGIIPFPFDPEEAKRLLDEAGWAAGADGIREKDGQKFTFTHGTTSGNQTRETIQALVQANLRDVGVEMTIANQPASRFFGGFNDGGGWLDRSLDMVGFTNGLSSSDPNLRPFWHTESIPTTEKPNGFNHSGLSNPDLDQLLDDQLTELDDAARLELLKQAQQIVHDEVPMIPMYDRVTINSVSDRVKGIQMSPFGAITGLVWNIADWSME